jgi:uncharacterized protein
MDGPTAAMLPDGNRLHLQHGPIDLVIEAFGRPTEVQAAYDQAVKKFDGLLAVLVAELPDLRQQTGKAIFSGSVTIRMAAATQPFNRQFITPMAAVAGAVADEVVSAMAEGRRLERVYVNNGGDIALLLNGAAEFDVGIVARVDKPAIVMTATITAADPVRGIATSGWRGRSLSLGIADAVTVLAPTAAQADAAATVIANAVNLPGNSKIERVEAREMDMDSDLGHRLVTASVADLDAGEVGAALAAGLVVAEEIEAKGLINAAALCLNGQCQIVGRNFLTIAP